MPQSVARRAIVYCRISKDKTGAGLGVDRQEQDCRTLADQLGLAVIQVISDNDTSAYRGKRAGYEQLLEAIKAGQADAVLSWHTDRLHRQPVELERFIEIVEKHRTEVHFVQSGPVDLTTSAGRLHARIAGAVARHESEHKSERISRQRRQLAERARFGGGNRPFGYEADGVTLNAAEAAAIRAAFDILLAGGSLRGVMRLLADRELTTTKKKKSWESITTRQMLLRPRNAGLATFQESVVGQGGWPAIVSPDELRAVADILSRKDRRTSPGNTPRWLGSLLYRCGVCDDTLFVGTSGSPARPTYRCRSLRRGGRSHVARSALDLDPWVETMVLGALAEPSYAAKFAIPAAPPVDVTALRRRRQVLEQSGKTMARRLGQELVSEAEFEEFAVENRARIREVETELAAATRTSPVTNLVAAGDPRDAWARYSLDEKRAVLREVVTVTVLPSGSRGGRFDPSCIHLEWAFS